MCNAETMTETPDTPHGRLEWARRRANYDSAAEFAKGIGIHPTTYRAYENGQNGFAKLAPTIAKRLGVSIEWLLEGDGVPKTELPPAPVRVPVSPDQPIVPTPQSEDAIIIRSVDLSYAMGDGTNLEHYYEEEGVLFDPNFIRALTRASSDKLFLARGDGDSMFPTLINDDQVLIDTTQTTLNQQDRIWACALHGAGMIKRLRVVGEGRVEVRSDNPTVGNREVSAADLRIVGRVIWVGRRV
jgi:phage repressor protein C with HTH and peptisase S24 domain